MMAQRASEKMENKSLSGRENKAKIYAQNVFTFLLICMLPKKRLE